MDDDLRGLLRGNDSDFQLLDEVALRFGDADRECIVRAIVHSGDLFKGPALAELRQLCDSLARVDGVEQRRGRPVEADEGERKGALQRMLCGGLGNPGPGFDRPGRADLDQVEPEARASAAGIMNTVGWGGGALGPLFVGLATRYGGGGSDVENMSLAIAAGGVVYLVCAALLIAAMLCTRRPAPADVPTS